MNKLTTQKRVEVIKCLVEGNSIRSTVRITGVAKNTVTKLLCEIGKACSEYQNQIMVNLPCKKIQCDEIWSFVGAKEKNVLKEEKGKGRGDVWTWTALCPDTKLVPCWMVGNRNIETATVFMKDLAPRLANRVQLTTDGLRAYLEAVDSAFGIAVDYAQLVKIYGPSETKSERRYSPAQCIGSRKEVVTGSPVKKDISTSLIERQNLTMRMQMRRFTRLTNAFSKKIENHEHAIALHFMFYNFARIHQTLRITPAMAAGISDHVWSIDEIVGLLGEK